MPAAPGAGGDEEGEEVRRADEVREAVVLEAEVVVEQPDRPEQRASSRRRPRSRAGSRRRARGPSAGRARRALDQRDAEPGERAELRPDDHRADDQDRRVLVDADRRQQRRDDHEDQEDGGELDLLARPRLDLLPDDGVGRRALGVRIAASACSEMCESISTQRDRAVLGRGRARAGRRSRCSRPRARRRRGSGRRPGAAPRRGRWTMLQTASEPSSTSSVARALSPARRSAGGSRAEPTAGAGPCPAPADAQSSSKNSSRAATAVSGKSENRPSIPRA